MKKSEPHTGAGNPAELSVSKGRDPVSRRAAIAAKARKNPKEQFNNLLHHLSYELVEECLNKIPRTSGKGVDGMSVVEAQQNLSWLLPPILKQIHEGCYEPPPVRRAYIPKADGKKRPIGIPAVIDRAIQAAMTKILNEIYEQDFLKCSFGFRPGLGCHHALATINCILYSFKLKHVLEVDIQDFFGSLSHDWPGKFLRHRIGDERVLSLIEAWLKAGVMEEGKLHEVERGTPQGGSISPLLANIYLHYVLDLWFEKKMNLSFSNRPRLVRYADDFCLFFNDGESVEKMRILLNARLAQFGLVTAEEKTHHSNLGQRESGSTHERRKMSFLGFTIYLSKKRNRPGAKTVFSTDGKRYGRAKLAMKERIHRMMHWPVEKQSKAINSVLRGHMNYYGLAGNGRGLEKFWRFVKLEWKNSLSRRSQKGRLTWESYNALLEKYPLVAPKIKLSYGELVLYERP